MVNLGWPFQGFEICIVQPLWYLTPFLKIKMSQSMYLLYEYHISSENVYVRLNFIWNNCLDSTDLFMTGKLNSFVEGRFPVFLLSGVSKNKKVDQKFWNFNFGRDPFSFIGRKMNPYKKQGNHVKRGLLWYGWTRHRDVQLVRSKSRKTTWHLEQRFLIFVGSTLWQRFFDMWMFWYDWISCAWWLFSTDLIYNYDRWHTLSA